MSEFDSFSQFPISFPIELISSDEDSSILFTCAEDDAIGGNSLIRFDLNDISYFDLTTSDLFASWFVNEGVFLIIGFLISLLPIPIIIGFFEKGKAKH